MAVAVPVCILSKASAAIALAQPVVLDHLLNNQSCTGQDVVVAVVIKFVSALHML